MARLFFAGTKPVPVTGERAIHMARWSVEMGDILDVRADALVCSANPYLNMSGGVGGAFLLRYGPEMQSALHSILAEKGRRHLPQGTVVVTPPCGSPYRLVLHAIAVNVSYESSVQVIEKVVCECLKLAARAGAHSIAIPLLATGYGKLGPTDFGLGITSILHREFDPVEHIVICARRESDAAIVRTLLSD